MDTGKILIGFAFLLLSAALMVSPSSAEMQGLHCDAGCGCAGTTGQSAALSPVQYGQPASAGTGFALMDPADPADLP
ncbi:hypothetical protein [uncultured Methanoregula sp.]|uniref:hypothetical protein n=1 Tax=uncultured Methanoregula sp. TaxID=1005933 RepID=UPI002AAB1563|nr:hypothetical protein [uncultured Methanoregula sp.]